MAANATGKKRANGVISVKREGETLVFNLHGKGEPDQIHVPIIKQFKFEPKKCHEKLREIAMWHGFEQRLRDRAAKPCDAKTGKSASSEEKFQSIVELGEFYLKGGEEWNLRGGATGPRQSDDKQLLKAALGIVREDRTAEQIHDFVEKLTKQQVSALLLKEEIKTAAELIRQEQTADIDTDELLSEF